ncbi:MAG: PHP domain-containing protein [Eubacteriales bacterium]|nr:PHP domain-containing protein [Eubacteriales bacterium]
MKNTVDLHVHSSCSDGTCTPSELVSYAKKQGLCAFALTDHDTTAGIDEAAAAAAKLGVELIAGIEFSTEYHGRDIHIVGLDIDYNSAVFSKELSRFRSSRALRNQKMIRKLREEGGIDISAKQMQERFGESVWTRAHFARYLFEHGYVSEMWDAFKTYVGEDCPYFVPREKVTPAQAVDLILRTGGIPILAHPLLYALDEPDMDELILSLKKCGLIGLETFYATYTPLEELHALRLAEKHGLLPSGGSDFHGSNKPDINLGSGRGNLSLPYELLQNLRDRRTHYE